MEQIYADEADVLIPGWAHWLSDKGVRWFHCRSDREFDRQIQRCKSPPPEGSAVAGVCVEDDDGSSRVIVRWRYASVFAHESGHALDAVLSSILGRPERFYSQASWIEHEAASGIGRTPSMAQWNAQEFFAECFRVYVGANDRFWTASTGSRFNRRLLHEQSPSMYGLFESVFVREVIGNAKAI